MEKKKKTAIISTIIILLMIVSTCLDYKADKYTSISQSSQSYILFVISFYQASNLFCTPDYNCTFSNMTFPELQKNELQKFQDQADWTSKRALLYNSLSSSFILLAIISTLYLLYFTYKD